MQLRSILTNSYFNGTYLPAGDSSSFVETLLGSFDGDEINYVEPLCSNSFGGFFQLLLLLVVYGAVNLAEFRILIPYVPHTRATES